jgi:hypothetical protein
VLSLRTERTFSIRTELAASTVAPGSTAPDASRTTPVIAPCAKAAVGRSKTTQRDAADRRDSGPISASSNRASIADEGFRGRGFGA